MRPRTEVGMGIGTVWCCVLGESVLKQLHRQSGVMSTMWAGSTVWVWSTHWYDVS